MAIGIRAAFTCPRAITYSVAMHPIAAQRTIEPRQSHYFDILRGVSAIVVLLGHAVPLYIEGERVFPALAGAAVATFFVLSGFFIHKSLARNTTGGLFDWRTFGAARINRIVPTFVAALAVTAACWAVAPTVFESGTRAFLHPTVRETISLEGFWRTAFLMNGFLGLTVSANGALWSLSYEVWYYAGAALFFLAVGGRRLAWVGVAIVPVLAVLDPMFAVWMLFWLGGMAISIAHASDALDWVRPWMAKGAAILPAAGMCGVVLAPAPLLLQVTLVFQLLWGAWFLVHMPRALQVERLPHVPLLAATAKFSYSLYVLHFPLLLVAYGMREEASLLPVAVVTILAAVALVGPPLERFRPIARRTRTALA